MEDVEINFNSFAIEELKYNTSITAIDSKVNETMLATGDEKGIVAIWDLRLSK